MVFGISMGQDKTKTSSSSSSYGYDWARSLADAFTNQQSTSSTAIDPTQGGFLNNLWGQASRFVNPNNTDERAQEIIGQMMPGLQGAFQNLTQLTDPSGQIATQAGALQQGLGTLFSQEIMPQLKSDAIAAGGFGGGRQGVAEGVAAGQLADSYTSGLADITAAANAQALSAATGLGTLGRSIFDLGQQGMNAGLDQLTTLAGILGGPTVLSQSQSTGQSRSTSASSSAGENASTSKSKGKSSGWKLGF